MIGGDIIVSIDHQALSTFNALRDAIAQRKPGDKVELGLYRHGSKKSVTVKLGNRS